jgi:hypothetical protein
MSRELLALEKGLRLYKENSDTESLDILFGAGIPGGDSGEQDAAAIGSAYFRENGTFYQKIASTNATTDWQLNGNGSTSVLPVFDRSIVVRAMTADSLAAGTINLTTTPFTDDNTPLLTAADFAVNEYLIANNILYKVTAVSSPSITIAAASPVMAMNEGFIVQNYLLNAPGSMENQALVFYNGTTVIKLADAYTSVAGSITSADTVESAIAKLDQGEKDLVSLSGVAANSVNLGTFTGTTIPDSQTVKQALQSLESAFESNGQVSAGPITTLATVDSVLVDSVAAVKWYIRIWEDATPANVQAFELFAMHNGSASADASVSKDQEYAVMKSGSAFNHVVSVDLNGSGVAQVLRLRMSSSTAGISAKIYREVVKF